MGRPSDDDDGVEEIDVSDTGTSEEENDEGDEAEQDRGDVVNPEETEDNLKALAEEGEEEGEEEAETPAKSGAAIPKARFDEVNEKRIRAEERARLLEEQLKASGKPATEATTTKADAIDLKDLRKQQRAALMEGDEEKAAELDDKIDAEMERRATVRATAAIQQSQEKQALNDVAAAVIEDYPFLDSKSPKANKEAIAEVVEWRDFYISRGKTAADALMAAAKKVGPNFAPKKAAKDDDEGDAEGEQAAPKAPKSKLDELRAARLRKNAAAANNQPARLDGGLGNRGTGGKLNVVDMDDETFNSLSEKEKAKLRGDVA